MLSWRCKVLHTCKPLLGNLQGLHEVQQLCMRHSIISAASAGAACTSAMCSILFFQLSAAIPLSFRCWLLTLHGMARVLTLQSPAVHTSFLTEHNSISDRYNL